MTIQPVRLLDTFAEALPDASASAQRLPDVAVGIRGLRKWYGQNHVLRGIDLVARSWLACIRCCACVCEWIVVVFDPLPHVARKIIMAIRAAT